MKPSPGHWDGAAVLLLPPAQPALLWDKVSAGNFLWESAQEEARASPGTATSAAPSELGVKNAAL